MRREKSSDPRNTNVRIKSAMPMNIDRERLMEENISLKNQLNKMHSETINHKREINNLENEISQKEKMIEDIKNETQNGISNYHTKPSEMHIVVNIKKQFKELKKEYEKSLQELDNAKRNIKYTKIKELNCENQIFQEQIDKLKYLYQHSNSQNKNLQKNIYEFTSMKEELSKQDYLILNYQESNQKMGEEINNLNIEIEKLKKQKNEKIDILNKLKQKLKLQHQINEKLVMTRDNIKATDEYLSMKNAYEKKLQKTRKDLAYYRDSNAKNERLIRDMKQKDNVISSNTTKTSSRIIYASNPKPFPDLQPYPEKETNSKILLLQSRFQEEKTNREKLEKEIEVLKKTYNEASKPETKVILQNSNSNNNIVKPINVKDYDYMSNLIFNDFIYVIVKNLEANKIDKQIIESRILNVDNLNLLNDKSNYKLFISNVSNDFIDILKVKQEKDVVDIHSFVKTLLFNNFISKKCNIEEFKNKVLELFNNISFYSIEQKQELNKVIALKFNPVKDKLKEKISFFDDDNKGYISFDGIKKIIEELDLKLKKDYLEYIIYIMKVNLEEGTYLKDLKYENLFKIINDTQIDPNENIEENKENQEKDDDDAIEITNEEYLNKVNDIIGRICKVLLEKKKNIDEYFGKVLSKSVTDYNAIRLVYLVEVLKNEFNIDLSNIEIFCLFTKVKPGNSKDVDDDMEEIIDYNKFKKEIEKYLRNPPKKEKEKEIKKEKEKEKEETKVSNKLNYSEKYENAKEKPIEKSKEEENIKSILLDFMKQHSFSFERFIFPVHCMMKLSTNGKKFNRFLDIEFFKHFLYQNGILIHNKDINAFFEQDKLLLSGDKVNIDYLKFVLDGRKGIRHNLVNEFMTFKPIIERPEAAKIREKKEEKNVTNDKDLEKDFYGDEIFDDIDN